MTDNQKQIQELTDRISESDARILDFQALLESNGWKTYQAVLADQIRMRRNTILTESFMGLDGIVEREKMVSELQGITLVKDMPCILIEELRLEIAGARELLQSLESEE